jgi:hypothetical protein
MPRNPKPLPVPPPALPDIVPAGPAAGVSPHSSYTGAAAAAVCRDVENGVPPPAAFLCNGIPAKTGEAWLAARADFAHEVAVARARYLRSLIQEVREAVAGSGARHDWRASFALLERADKSAAAAVIDPDTEKPDVGSIMCLSYEQLVDLQARRRAAAR